MSPDRPAPATPDLAKIVEAALRLGGLDPEARQLLARTALSQLGEQQQLPAATADPVAETANDAPQAREGSAWRAEGGPAKQKGEPVVGEVLVERHRTQRPRRGSNMRFTDADRSEPPVDGEAERITFATASPPEIVLAPRRSGRRKWVAVAAAAALVGGAATGVSYTGEPKKDTCTTATTAQEVVGVIGGPFIKERNQARDLLSEVLPIHDNRTWAELAATLSEQRGYYIAPARLARANNDSGLSVYDDGGRLQPAVAKTGLACVQIPAPIAAGQVITNGKDTLNQYAQRFGIEPATLKMLNFVNALAPDKPIPADFTIWLTDKPNPALVYRSWSADLLKEVNGDVDLLQAVVKANNVKSTNDLQPGQLGYFPYNQTPQMKKANIEPKAVSTAYADAYDFSKRPENQLYEGLPNKANKQPAALSDEQIKIIDSLPNLKNEPQKREGLKQILQYMLTVREGVTDINMAVMMAQAITESGYNTSEIAKKTNNYFGMKANNGWAGPTYTDPKDSSRVFRVYATPLDGFKGYIENIRSKNWYDDARRDAATIDGYLNGLLNEPAYTPDAGYRETILNVIKDNRIVDLLVVKAAPDKSQENQPPAASGTEVGGKIVIDMNKYPEHQRVLWHNGNGAYITTPQGTKLSCDELNKEKSNQKRLELIQENLNNMHVNPAGYEAWKQKSFVDDRQEIANGKNPNYESFRPSYNNHGSFAAENPNVNPMANAELFIWHYTATSGATTYRQGGQDKQLDGPAFANSMGQRHLGVQFYTDNHGVTYYLTDAHTVHARNRQQLTGDPNDNYLESAYGNEILASEQADVKGVQYEAAVYAATRFLIDGNKVKKTDSIEEITKQVNYRIRGHREVNYSQEGDHSDFPAYVSAPMRGRVIGLLQAMGYGGGAQTK